MGTNDTDTTSDSDSDSESTNDGWGGGEYPDGPFGDPMQAPYTDDGEPHPVPGKIQVQDFDEGGEGVAYHETDPPADWAVDVRGTDIDFKPTPDADGEYSVGKFRSDEWLEYTCAVEPGTYTLRVRCGTAREGRALDLTLDGESLATVDVPVTGWSSHTTVSAEIDIGGDPATAPHERVLRLSPTADGVDVAWVEFVAIDLEPVPEPDPEPPHSHTTVRVTAGDRTTQLVVDAPPGEVSVETHDGIATTDTAETTDTTSDSA